MSLYSLYSVRTLMAACVLVAMKWINYNSFLRLVGLRFMFVEEGRPLAPRPAQVLNRACSRSIQTPRTRTCRVSGINARLAAPISSPSLLPDRRRSGDAGRSENRQPSGLLKGKADQLYDGLRLPHFSADHRAATHSSQG